MLKIKIIKVKILAGDEVGCSKNSHITPFWLPHNLTKKRLLIQNNVDCQKNVFYIIEFFRNSKILGVSIVYTDNKEVYKEDVVKVVVNFQ